MTTVRGRIIDADSLDGIEETPIYLDNEIVAVTNDDGAYMFTASPGRYKFEIRPRGYLYIIRRVRIAQDGSVIDADTGRVMKREIRMIDATL